MTLLQNLLAVERELDRDPYNDSMWEKYHKIESELAAQQAEHRRRQEVRKHVPFCEPFTAADVPKKELSLIAKLNMAGISFPEIKQAREEGLVIDIDRVIKLERKIEFYRHSRLAKGNRIYWILEWEIGIHYESKPEKLGWPGHTVPFVSQVEENGERVYLVTNEDSWSQSYDKAFLRIRDLSDLDFKLKEGLGFDDSEIKRICGTGYVQSFKGSLDQRKVNFIRKLCGGKCLSQEEAEDKLRLLRRNNSLKLLNELSAKKINITFRYQPGETQVYSVQKGSKELIIVNNYIRYLGNEAVFRDLYFFRILDHKKVH